MCEGEERGMHVQDHVTTTAQGMSDSERLCEQLRFLFVLYPGGTECAGR